MGNVFEAFPYRNTLCSFDTTGPELWRTVEKYVAG
eukprot:gene7117-8706_t